MPLYRLILSPTCPHCHLVQLFWSLQNLASLCAVVEVSHIDEICPGPVLQCMKTREELVHGEKVLLDLMAQSSELRHWRTEGGQEWESLMKTLYQSIMEAGYAMNPWEYNQAFNQVFEILAAVEKQLASSQYLTGGDLAQADWMLFVIMIRFDAVYYPLYKCNAYRLVDYPFLFRYMLELIKNLKWR